MTVQIAQDLRNKVLSILVPKQAKTEKHKKWPGLRNVKKTEKCVQLVNNRKIIKNLGVGCCWLIPDIGFGVQKTKVLVMKMPLI